MRSRTTAALFAVLTLATPTVAQTPPRPGVTSSLRENAATVRLSPAALRRRAVTCKVPVYPGGGHVRHLRVRSTVTVEILIDEEGRVQSARVVSGHPLLHASAVQAAWKWTFRPVKVKGKPVTAGGILVVAFSPDFDEMERQCKGLRRAS